MTRTAITPWEWSIPFGFDQAELVEGPSKVLVCSGQTSIGTDGTVQHVGDIGAQAQAAYDNLETVLAAAGMTLEDVVRITAYATDIDALHQSGSMLRGGRRAFTLIGVSRLAYPELLVELEAIAVRSGS